ncbi:MAG TPA: TonB-dependent receptor, partial [Terriglobales bacterium]|nr:TonB-dependent receptor [Terriglobales bacterium]
MRIMKGSLCLLLVLLAGIHVWAQSQITTGAIQGTVLDPSNAVVPGASVEVKEVSTNFTRSQTTNGDGRFVFLQLPPGRYTVTVSGKSGFGTVVQENVVLTVGQTISLNVGLKLVAAGDKIVVTDTPTIDVTRIENSNTLDTTTVSTTPILGRKFEDLLTLTPGVAITQGPDGDEINFSGQRGIFNNISLDGGDYNNGFFGEQLGGQRAAIDINLDAVEQFQVIASGASAEFGRTAGGVVNVVSKSGTNNVHGSLFHYQRLEALTSNTSDGKPLDGFHREQFGGSIGGPIKKDKLFFFGSFEQIISNLRRPNLSAQLGATPCAVPTPTIFANEAQIAGNSDCQRLALVNFYKTRFNQEEGLPVNHPIRNSNVFGKVDWNANAKNKVAISYNFDYSRNENQTFDVATYGNSANGIEGPSKIQALNGNLFSTLSNNKLNELHVSWSRENRPRAAVDSKIPMDTGMDFVNAFRFGNPFFLGPTVDEVFWRTQIRDSFSWVAGKHTVKFGGEWMHSDNAQVFRGFFEGRSIFDSVPGFLRYASPAAAGGFGPTTGVCLDAAGALKGWVTWGAPFNETCPTGSSVGGPLILYLQGAGLQGPATDAAGFSDIANEDYS